MKYLLLLAYVFVLCSCNPSEKKEVNAQQIIDKAIKVSGKYKLKHSTLYFNFRNTSYTSEGKCNYYVYKRVTTKNDTTLTDVFNTKEKLKRFVNGKVQIIADTTALKYEESINSVNYFIQLPLRLNDDAVLKTYIGLDTIKGKSYHTIEIKFSKENGGTDFQDVYYYWFGKEDFKLDYLAYSFAVNGGGLRFREAFNERIIDGVRFVDYRNYKPKDEIETRLEDISKNFNNNELDLLSKIENFIERLEINEEQCR